MCILYMDENPCAYYIWMNILNTDSTLHQLVEFIFKFPHPTLALFHFYTNLQTDVLHKTVDDIVQITESR